MNDLIPKAANRARLIAVPSEWLERVDSCIFKFHLTPEEIKAAEQHLEQYPRTRREVLRYEEDCIITTDKTGAKVLPFWLAEIGIIAQHRRITIK